MVENLLLFIYETNNEMLLKQISKPHFTTPDHNLCNFSYSKIARIVFNLKHAGNPHITT